RDDGPTDEELDTTVARFRWEAAYALDEPHVLAEHVATQVQLGRSQSLAARAAEIAAVSRSRVLQVAREWWQPKRLNVVAVGAATKAQRRALEREIDSF